MCVDGFTLLLCSWKPLWMKNLRYFRHPQKFFAFFVRISSNTGVFLRNVTFSPIFEISPANVSSYVVLYNALFHTPHIVICNTHTLSRTLMIKVSIQGSRRSARPPSLPPVLSLPPPSPSPWQQPRPLPLLVALQPRRREDNLRSL